MNPLQQARGVDRASGTRRETPSADRRGSALPYPEGPPLLSLLVAGSISFLFLAMSPIYMGALVLHVQSISEEGGVGPLSLSLPIFTNSVLLEALLGSFALIEPPIALAERAGDRLE